MSKPNFIQDVGHVDMGERMHCTVWANVYPGSGRQEVSLSFHCGPVAAVFDGTPEAAIQLAEMLNAAAKRVQEMVARGAADVAPEGVVLQ